MQRNASATQLSAQHPRRAPPDHFSSNRMLSTPEATIQVSNEQTDLTLKQPSKVQSSKAESYIPVIDFGPFLNGTPDQKEAVAQKVVDAFKNVGFIYLANHGIPADQIATVFSKVRH